MALIAILWLVALLTLLATTVVTLSVTHRRTAERYAEAVQADMTVDAAIRVVLLRLIAPSDHGAGWPVDQPQGLSILDENVILTVQREAGRIDLNTADPDLLTAFFAGNGWRETDARSMAARIVDWRDADDETGEGGAESREYAAAKLSYAPHNGPFESVDELRQVLGSERIRTDLLDSFTVFTHALGCIESVATPAVRRGLQWADGRQFGGHRWLRDAPNSGRAGISAASVAALGGEVLRLRACVSGHVERCRVAVIRLTGNARKPLQVFEWRTQFAGPSEPVGY
jgi:general secretion pathway protein K